MEFAPPQAGLENIEGPDGVGDLTVTLKQHGAAWHGSAKPMAQLQLFVVLVVGLVLSQVKEQTETQMSATRAEQKHLDI